MHFDALGPLGKVEGHLACISDDTKPQGANPLQDLYTKPAVAMENSFAETQRSIERSHAIDAQRSGTTAGSLLKWTGGLYTPDFSLAT